MEKTSGEGPPHQISSDSRVWHTGLKNCVQQLRHIEITTWLEVLSGTGIVRASSLCIRACILSNAAEEAKPAARLHFAVKCALQ